MLEEIPIAHEMGAEVFVLDIGWFDDAGTWNVTSERFPNGLEPVKRALDERGMKLGLWLCPTASPVARSILEECGSPVLDEGYVSAPQSTWGDGPGGRVCLTPQVTRLRWPTRSSTW